MSDSVPVLCVCCGSTFRALDERRFEVVVTWFAIDLCSRCKGPTEDHEAWHAAMKKIDAVEREAR